MIYADKFWEKVKKVNHCLEWTGAINNKGYGVFYSKKKIYMAHRYSWMIHKGPIEKGLFVLHKCDNRRCVNPNHLFLGTHKDNMRDMVRKKRQAIGSQVASSKITADQVRRMREMRRRGMKYKDIAKTFGLSEYHTQDICRGRYWKHIV